MGDSPGLYVYIIFLFIFYSQWIGVKTPMQVTLLQQQTMQNTKNNNIFKI